MARSPEFDDDLPVSPSSTPQQSGWGRFLLKLFGIGGAITLLACCVICGGFSWFFSPTIAKTPTEVNEMTAKISAITIPESFQPDRGEAQDNSWVLNRYVRYQRSDGKGQMILLQTRLRISDDAAANAAFREQMYAMLMSREFSIRTVVDPNPETREIDVRGQKITFTIRKGEDASSNTKVMQVSGTFPGNDADVQLLLESEADVWDENEILTMLNSLPKE